MVQAASTALGNDTYRVRLVIQNMGWLPTYVTRKAVEKKAVRGVIVELELPEGATLETGKLRTDVGQLEGHAYKDCAVSVWNYDPTDERAKIEWTVRSPKGGVLKIITRHQHAGTVRTEVIL